MTLDRFNITLKDFLSQVYPRDEKVTSTELRIEMQPGMTSFGGHFTLQDDTETAIDIRQVAKSKCGQFSNDIESMHRTTTNYGQNKWNKATFKIDSKGQVEEQFIWDEKFEMESIGSFQDGGLTRQKWYWEEK